MAQLLLANIKKDKKYLVKSILRAAMQLESIATLITKVFCSAIGLLCQPTTAG
jgi:hypothetical protein